MSLLDQIQNMYTSFSPNEKKIADYIQNHTEEFSRLDMRRIIAEIGVSNAAMIRFAKKLGFDGYSALKFEITRSLIQNNFPTGEKSDDIIHSVTSTYIQALSEMNAYLNLIDLENAAKLIRRSRRVKIFAYSKSAHSAGQFCDRCMSIGVDITPVFNDLFALSGNLELMNEEDTAIFFTTADNTHLFSKSIPFVQNSGCHLIIVTMDRSLTFLNQADYRFVLPAISGGSTSEASLSYRDNQVLFDIFTEIFVSTLASLQSRDHE